MVDTILPGEQDIDSQSTFVNFLTHALTDCVAQGAQEYMFILCSHGGGYAGFGGHEFQVRQRRLAQSNLSILGGIQIALASVAGAPARLDVLGFDACLMSAVGALDEYREVTK